MFLSHLAVKKYPLDFTITVAFCSFIITNVYTLFFFKRFQILDRRQSLDINMYNFRLQLIPQKIQEFIQNLVCLMTLCFNHGMLG